MTRCSFCDARAKDVRWIFLKAFGPAICDECLDICVRARDSARAEKKHRIPEPPK